MIEKRLCHSARAMLGGIRERVMLKLHLSWGLAFLVAAGGLRAAEADLGIPLGDYRVHPSRILARYNDPQSAASPQAV